MASYNYIDLGRFICVRANRDGTHRVMMVAPKRLRPDGWPSTIRLPEIGSKVGSLDDPEFRERVVKDAQRLNRRFDKRREADAIHNAPDKTLPALAPIYLGRDVYQNLSEARRYRNRRSIGKILEWSAARGHPEVASLTARDVDDFLSIYDARSATRFDMRSVWNMLFDTAIYAGWISESPMRKGNWNTPKPKRVRVWKPEDVRRYCDMADQMNQPGLAAMILTMFEIGQRPGDMRTARWDREFLGDRFVIEQSKTRSLVNVPVQQSLRDLLEAVRVRGSPYVFNNFDTEVGAFSAYTLRRRFLEVRHALAEPGESQLHLRTLRHSCVCRLMEAGLSTGEIAGITGHLLARVHSILERYYPDRAGLAESGMRRAFVARGLDPKAFGHVKPLEIQDWKGDPSRPDRYQRPLFTERNLETLRNVVLGRHRHGRQAHQPPAALSDLLRAATP